MMLVRQKSRSSDPESIHACAETGKLKRLIELASVNGKLRSDLLQAKEHMLQMTPLHFAAEHGHLPIVQFLLQSQVEANVGDQTRTTALHLAAVSNHADIVRCLLSHGASVALVDDQGDTALHWAATKGHVEVIELLLAHQSHIDSTNKVGWTPLHRAAFNGRVPACQLLLRKGATLQYVTHDGNSALHLAASANHLGAMEALLQSGASTSTSNKAGHLPLDMCISDAAREMITTAAAKGPQHPLRQEYLRTHVVPDAANRTTTSPAPGSRAASAGPAAVPAAVPKKPIGFGFPLEQAEPATQSGEEQTDDPSSAHLFSYVTATSRPGTSERAPSARPIQSPEGGRPSSARKLVEALRSSNSSGSGNMAAGDVSPWEAAPRTGSGVGALPSADAYQESVRIHSRQAAASEALLNPVARETANKKFLDKYGLNRLNLFAP